MSIDVCPGLEISPLRTNIWLSFSQLNLGPRSAQELFFSGFSKSLKHFFSKICAHSERYRNLLAGIFETNFLWKLRVSIVTNLREVTIVTALTPCDFSYSIYPGKNSRPFPASSHIRQPTQHQHRHTSHLTVDKQDWLINSLVGTPRRITIASTEARNRRWSMSRTRGVGLFRRAASTAAYSLCLLPCLEKNASSYECGLDMTGRDPS